MPTFFILLCFFFIRLRIASCSGFLFAILPAIQKYSTSHLGRSRQSRLILTKRPVVPEIRGRKLDSRESLFSYEGDRSPPVDLFLAKQLSRIPGSPLTVPR